MNGWQNNYSLSINWAFKVKRSSLTIRKSSPHFSPFPMGKIFPSPLFPIPHGEKIRWGYVNPSWGKISKSLEFCLRLLMWNVKGLLLVGWGTLYREYQSPFLKLLLAKVYGLNCPSRPRFFCLLWCFNVIIL